MTVQLPEDVEIRLQALVNLGYYASVDDAVAVAVRLLLQQPRINKKPTTQDAFHQHLIAIGMLSRLPNTEADYDDPDDQPVTILGEPLSETIIRERR